mgnify:CR=1 FL=1
MFSMLLSAATVMLLSMTITPSTCLAPCDLRVKLSVEPARDNQKVILVLDSEESDYYRLSELPLNEQSPKTVNIRYPSVPAGAFTLTASLVKHDGVTTTAATVRKSVVVR